MGGVISRIQQCCSLNDGNSSNEEIVMQKRPPAQTITSQSRKLRLFVLSSSYLSLLTFWVLNHVWLYESVFGNVMLCMNQRMNTWLVKSHCFGARCWLSLLLSCNM